MLLTIAGHDPSSGAGITADLQTFAAHGFFGLSAITALTVQSTLGVAALKPVHAEFLRQALDHLISDLTPSGYKIGMLGSTAIVRTVADFLQSQVSKSSHNTQIPIVFDPVLRASSGRELLPVDALELLHERLLPLVTWVTPNWAELSALTAIVVKTPAQAQAATNALGRRHPHLSIIATAGEAAQPTDLLRLPSGEVHLFPGEHIDTTSTHGTGCAFSSALLCQLVLGADPIAAVAAAKHFVTEALHQAPGLGHGRGPMNLLWPLRQSTRDS
jgi:hydroxymethylpyrimidine/phosphomethylpyrimidine kinase